MSGCQMGLVLSCSRWVSQWPARRSGGPLPDFVKAIRVPSPALQNLTPASLIRASRTSGTLRRMSAAPGASDVLSASRCVTGGRNRIPRRATVAITDCRRPSSPTALRASAIRAAIVASDTIRPCQMVSTSSSRVTSRSRLRARWRRRSKTCGSRWRISPRTEKLCRSVSISQSRKTSRIR